MTRIAILGAAGYTALELIKILLRHPDVEIVTVTDVQEGQPHIAMIHPSLLTVSGLCVSTPCETQAGRRIEGAVAGTLQDKPGARDEERDDGSC